MIAAWRRSGMQRRLPAAVVVTMSRRSRRQGIAIRLAGLLAVAPLVHAGGPSVHDDGAVVGVPDHHDGVVVGALGARLDDWMTRMERFGVHGALLIEHDGAVVLRKGYGVADRATGRPIRAETVFHVGSLGKPFTAAAILELQEQGRLDVDDPIARHLDDVPDDKAAITIHHLLTHTAGLPYQPGAGSALSLPLQFEPGERWSYANPGYTLLADIVDAAAGSPFEDFLHRAVLAPAGMSDTHFAGSGAWPEDRVAIGYTDETAQDLVSRTTDPTYRGAGGLATTVADLHRWEQALRAHVVLGEASTEAFFREHVRNPGAALGYAYGWRTATTPRGTRIVLHQGNYGGFNADYRRYLDEGTTIIFLSNHFVYGRSMRDAVVNDVSRIVHGSEHGGPPDVVGLDPPALDRRAGTFTLDGGNALDVQREGDALRITARGPRAASVLFAPALDDTGRAFLEQSKAAVVDIVEGALRGDAAPLRSRVSPSLPFPGAWDALQEMAASWAARGELVTVHHLGTALAAGPESGRTFVRVELEDGTADMQVTWSDGRVIHLAQGDAHPSRLVHAAADGGVALPGRFYGYDVFTGEVTVVEFPPDGRSMELRPEGGDTPIVARRRT